jgi:hypothetical protein
MSSDNRNAAVPPTDAAKPPLTPELKGTAFVESFVWVCALLSIFGTFLFIVGLGWFGFMPLGLIGLLIAVTSVYLGVWGQKKNKFRV